MSCMSPMRREFACWPCSAISACRRSAGRLGVAAEADWDKDRAEPMPAE